MKRILLILIFIVSLMSSKSYGQQEAMISQFVMNTMAINPGYTGYREIQSINLTHRSQWIGFEGAPNTDIVTFDMALENNRKIAFGGSIMRDVIGPTSEVGATLSFAYRLQLGREKILSMGLQGYAGLIQANFSNLIIGSQLYEQSVVDDLLVANPENVFVPNAGFGLYYHTPKYFIGLSAPRLLRAKIDDANVNNTVSVNGRTEPTLFFMAGKSFEINSFYDLQPAIFVKGTQGAPISIGGNLNLLYGEVMKLGLFYNYKEVVGAMFQYRVSTRTRLGYSFDVSTNRLGRTNLGSHEISVAYVFRDLRRRIVYPRKF